MKKTFLTLLFIGIIAISAQGQKVIGSYHNDYFQKDFEVSASEKDGKQDLYIQVSGSTSKTVQINFSLDEESLPKFRNTFIDIKNKYLEWSKVAKENNVTDMSKNMDFHLPEAIICWNSGSKWHFSFNHKLQPAFMILDDGRYLTTIVKKVESSSNKYISENIYWAFSNEQDFDEIINWLDFDKIQGLLNKEKVVKDLGLVILYRYQFVSFSH